MFTDEQWNWMFKNEGLTDRCIHIAELALSGFSNKQIANSMGINLKTVEADMIRTFRALEVDGIRELFAWVVEKFLSTQEARRQRSVDGRRNNCGRPPVIHTHCRTCGNRLTRKERTHRKWCGHCTTCQKVDTKRRWDQWLAKNPNYLKSRCLYQKIRSVLPGK